MVSAIELTSVAESTARSISAAVARALNWRPSWIAMPLNEAASSANSSRLATVTRVAKSRSAMRRVPFRSSINGSTLRRICRVLNRSTASTETTTTTRNVLVNSTIGASTSASDWLSTKFQSAAPNASSSTSGHSDETRRAAAVPPCRGLAVGASLDR